MSIHDLYFFAIFHFNYQKMNRVLALLKVVSFFSIVLFLSQCSDPTLVGADLLDDFKSTIEFTDTISVSSQTVEGDTALTFSPFINFSATPFSGQMVSHLFGDYKSDVYGRTKSSVYGQITLNSTPPNFEEATLIDLELILPYELEGNYGKTDQEFGINVYEVTETIPNEVLFTNDAFDFDPTPIISYNFVPNLDSVELVTLNRTNPDTLPYLRIPLDDNRAFVAKFLLEDTTTYQSNTAFVDFFRGFYFEPSKETEGVISFGLRPDYSNLGGLYITYTIPAPTFDMPDKRDTVQYQFPFGSSSVRLINVTHDYTNSIVESFIENPALGDSLTFIQGLAGLQTKINFPYITSLDDVLVNKAELEFFILDQEESNSDTFPAIEQLISFQTSVFGERQLLEDFIIVSNNRRNLEDIFGGVVVEGNNITPDKYTMNITAAFQNMLDRNIVNEIILGVSASSENANRVILYGANHPQYPMRLNLTFTKR